VIFIFFKAFSDSYLKDISQTINGLKSMIRQRDMTAIWMKKNHAKEIELKTKEIKNLQEQKNLAIDSSNKFELFTDRLAVQYSKIQELKVVIYILNYIFIIA
jgi:hypothetical protein